MKIHIVQKGDTLWEISKAYGVDFQELVQLNSHLSSPDLIMPGMKIKIPSTSKPVKKEMKKPVQQKMVKEKPKELPKVTHPYKPITPKPTEVNKEKPIVEKKEKPIFTIPKMPIIEDALPEIPKEKPVQPIKEKKEKPIKKPIEKPSLPPVEDMSPEEVIPEYMPPPMIPMIPPCHYVHPCCYHIFHPFMPMHAPHYGPMMPQAPYQGVQQAYMEESPHMPVPYPMSDCGCHGQGFHQPTAYHMLEGTHPLAPEGSSHMAPNLSPFPKDYASHFMNQPLYPHPPVGEGPPSFKHIREDVDEEETNREE